MYHALTFTGVDGALLYGYAEAALLASWRIERDVDPKRGPFRLTAIIRTRNRVWCSAGPLLFTAKKLGGGRPWCWPVLEIQFDDNMRLTARLGPPEQ